MRYDVKGIDQNVLIQLYKNMLKSRMIEDKMIILLRQGKVSKWFSGIGQEAISAGVTQALKEEEYILPMHRNLGVLHLEIFLLIDYLLNGKEKMKVLLKEEIGVFILDQMTTK